MHTDQTQSVGVVIADGQRFVNKRDKIIHSVNLHERLAPAVSCLPAELLSEIFMLTLPPFDSLPPSKLRSPMLLTRICRSWREVAVGTPSLWCRLFGGSMNSYCWRVRREAFCYRTWLKRSRGLPLSLTFTRCPQAGSLTYLLQRYTNQISSLRITYCAATRDLLLNDLPALQVLIIEGQVNGEFGKSVIVRSIMDHSFTLRSLKVSAPPFLLYLAAFDPSKISRWPHLTHVEISVCQQDVLLKLLQQAPNLFSAKILIEHTMPSPLPTELCTHTKLQILHIHRSRSFPPPPNLLNFLSLPNLREFMTGSVWMWWPHEEFKALLARSQCPLEFLSFGDAMTAISKLYEWQAEYIALIPSLEVVVNPASGRRVRYCRGIYFS
jgi:hypothetical protein